MKYLLAFLMILPCCLFAQGKYDGGNGDGFATIIVSGVVLPLQVIHFTAAENNGSVTAQLKIQSDENICGLQLERSSDGNLFTMVDEKQAMPPGLQGEWFVFADAATAMEVLFFLKRYCCKQIIAIDG
jgi:hypothetical protein